MSTLEALQRQFQAHLLRGDPAIEARVSGSERVPVDTRLGIYRGAYVTRLAEALAANYPALALLLGEDEFGALAQEYVRGHDSPFFSIRYYGDQLPQFLATHEEYVGAPILAELARWEWTMTLVFDAADAPALTHEHLQRIAPERWAQLRFDWHPSVQRLGLHWNVPQTWQALLAGAPRPAASVAESATPWLLWRQGLTSYYRSLAAAEAEVLDAARSGWPFGEVCTRLCEAVGEAEAARQAASLLRTWVEAGLITATV
ncbi:MAG: putative DNA-binding domain-containing protein [Gammaproteobacteria bacterium]|nr:putative DNA-binding domain-containing protein [Gammaproteobacteria bacterium]